MDHIKELLRRDRFAQHCGIELVSVAPGHAVARMPLQAWHLNGLGVVQGGAVFTLADFAFALASNSHGQVAIAINVSINFMKGVGTGTLTAEARKVAVNPKLGTYAITVTDDRGALIATFQDLAYRKKESVQEVVKRPA